MPAKNNAVAFLGGAFDPPHAGHLHLARAAMTNLPVREIRIVPNGDPRHRAVVAPWADRVAMCEIAFAEISGAKICRDESPGTPRFSADTLRAMKSAEPRTAIIFIVGADAFSNLESWREWRALFSLTHFAVAPRKNASSLSPELESFCAGRFCENPDALQSGAGKVLRWNVCIPDISSSAVRARVSAFHKEMQKEEMRKGGAGMQKGEECKNGGVGVGGGEFEKEWGGVLQYAHERALYG